MDWWYNLLADAERPREPRATKTSDELRPAMDEKTFQTKLANLMGEINTLPASERQKLAKLAEQTKERHTKMKKSMSDLQESLDYLRLSIKYLVFDLEATRRENQYLRDMLNSQDADGQGNDDADDTPMI